MLKSLIIFRQAELAQVMGYRAEALRLYQESLALDLKMGNNRDQDLIQKLIRQVS